MKHMELVLKFQKVKTLTNILHIWISKRPCQRHPGTQTSESALRGGDVLCWGVAPAVHAVHLVLFHWIFIFSFLWLTDTSFDPSFRIHISVAVDQSSPSAPSYKHRRDLSLSTTFYNSNFSGHLGGRRIGL